MSLSPIVSSSLVWRLSVGVLLLTTHADAILCVRKNGAVFQRDTCRPKETAAAMPTALQGVPGFKTPDGIGFPIVYAGGVLISDPFAAAFIVVPCDRLFEKVVGAACGGPAEDRLMRYLSEDPAHPHPVPRLIERFDASPRTSVSIYRP